MSLQQHFEKLAVEIGARPLGSEANLRAAAYAAETLAGLGWTVEKQAFDCMRWRNDGARLAVDGAPVNAQPAPYAAPCEVAGELVVLDTPEALHTAELRGKIALLRGSLAENALSPKDNPFWYPDEDRAVIERLESAGLLALLTAGLPGGDAPLIDDGGFAVPCATLARADADKLRSGQTVALTIDATRGKASAYNVLARLGGDGKRVCVSAHIDTKAFTPGALDNASGTAVVLALAEALQGVALPFAVELAIFNGEDYYNNVGETTYMRQSLTDPARYLWAANVDGVGMPDCDTTVALFDCPEALAKAARELPATGWREIEPWPQGDHTLYAMHGIPALALTSANIFGAPLHTPEDSPAHVSLAKMEETARYLQNLILKSAALYR